MLSDAEKILRLAIYADDKANDDISAATPTSGDEDSMAVFKL